jgi:hypothetical protein
VSKRSGDKARFGRERQRKILRRKRTRELREALEKEQHLRKDENAVGDRRADLPDHQDRP